jgi:hypothetical protein
MLGPTGQNVTGEWRTFYGGELPTGVRRIMTFSVNDGPHIRRWFYKILLTPWSRALLEKLTGLKLVKKFPAVCWTPRFITAFTSARHLSLSWASSFQSIPPYPTLWRSILILSSQWFFLPQIFPPKPCTRLSPHTHYMPRPLIRLYYNIIICKVYTIYNTLY